jgi:prolyl-tRNA synthetase
MRFSTLFGRTLREVPGETDYPALRLIWRAGLARQIVAGGYALLPLGLRAVRRIEAIVREELDAIGAQEVRSPMVQPAELWRASGRYDTYGPLMLRAQDSSGRDLVIAPTHEEALTELARREISSYRQLPVLAYQIGPKVRDELRARAGLVRLREFTMMDAYSFDPDDASLDRTYAAMRGAYERILQRCEVTFFPVEAATGQMGGSASVEFIAPSAHGEDMLVRCEHCGYAANSEVAIAARPQAERRSDEPLRAVATPECATIADLARYLGIPEAATAKAVFFWAPERGLIFAVIRGDLGVSTAKLAACAGVESLRAATAEEILAVGAVPGYASPVGLRGVYVVADPSVVAAGPLVAGANRVGYHLTGVTYGRDWEASAIADLVEVHAGDPCARCGAPLALTRGIEIGHVFKLGTRYSVPLGATFLDQQGQERPLVMGSYGIGIERLLNIIVEQHHDEAGIVWPASVAPALVHLLALGRSAETRAAAERLYAELQANHIPTLYDDRDESAGVKFTDADLIGLPLRVLVSDRLLREGAVEFKRRGTGELRKVSQGDVVRVVLHL